MRPVTQKDIASKLGMDDSTVSLALRNSDKISQATRDLVHKAAKDMGYSLNATAANLSKFRSNVSEAPKTTALAWLNCWKKPDALYSFEEFAQYWEGATDTAARLGYRLEEFQVGGDFHIKRFQEIIESRGIKGILIPPHGGIKIDPQKQFDWQKFSIVRFGRSIEYPAAHMASADQYGNMILAYERAIELGYQRIGMINVGRSHHTWINFDTGYLKAQQKLKMDERIPIYYDTPHDKASNLVEFKKWLKKYQPEAIISATGGVAKLVKAAGLKPGSDIGLATMTVLDTSIDAGIIQNSYEIGHVAARSLISQIQDHEFGPPALHHQIMVPGTWVDGESLPKIHR
jgi:DNA-binding LacI/PurR family transcriptional regulator